MARYIFDLETNGLLPNVSVIHSCVLKDADTGEVFSFGPIKDNFSCLELLTKADELIGHNIAAYDIPVMKKVWGLDLDPRTKITDTLVLARLAFTNVKDSDYDLVRLKGMPGKLTGRHSLEAWGWRLGLNKGGYTGGWETWNPEMQAYCERDIEVTNLLYRKLMNAGQSEVAMDLEHVTARLCDQIEANGFLFDEPAAIKLWQELEEKKAVLAEKLQTLFPPWERLKQVKGETVFISKVNNKKLGRVKGEPYSIPITVTFNPLSRDHIADRLTTKYGWVPTEFTEGGKPQIDETTLAGMEYPEAKQLAELFLLDKRIGSVSHGDQSWLKSVQGDKRIHGRYNSGGAVTGRATHSNPNIAQVPKVGKPYGKQCRALFTSPPGYVLLGADLQGLELRCLAHYMSRWDGGAYAKIVVEGDPHTENMKAAGLDLLIADPKQARDKAKTFIYAFLYGAGDAKIGSIVNGSAAKGKKLKQDFLKKTPALKALNEAVKTKAMTTKTLTGLDGRILKVRAAHASLNTLLQSCGAILCKAWIVHTDKLLKESGLKHGVGKDYAFCAWVHDELQIEIKEGLQDVVGPIVLRAAIEAGKQLRFIPPLTAEFKVGKNWADTH